MTTPATFFTMPEADVKRDGSGRPLLLPKGTTVRAPYSRASGLADFIEDLRHIQKWEMRYLAKGLGQNPDLAELAAVETYSTGISDAVFGRAKSASGRRLDAIIERVFDRVKIHEKADRGTAIHAATEPVNSGYVPERIEAPVRGFWDVVRREAINLVATEQFTANDVTMSAGTFDHLLRVPGHPLVKDTLVIGDKKTGRYDPFSWCCQLSTYAYGDPYDTESDTRPAWPGEINLEWGLVFHIDPETDDCKLVWVDLAFGWECAQLAARVRDLHERTDIAAPYKPASFEQRYAGANTADDLRRLWWSTEDPALREQVNQKASLL